ncbi:MAG: Uma2 family endonuclease [Caldilineaceae bacterium]
MSTRSNESPATKEQITPNGSNGHTPQVIPPLQPGDFLTRAEFERRYHNHPDLKKAELIEGIVYMPSPDSAAYHGDPHFDLIGWLGVYCATVPGLIGSDNATLRLDNINEPQPDILLRLDTAHGGRSKIDEEGYLEGPVEFVVEVASSSASYDMNQKKATYARHGFESI